MLTEELYNNNEAISHRLSAINLSATNKSEKPKMNGDCATTPYQRLMDSLQFDPKVQLELTLGKRVGFYTLRGELGCGNFSRVKAGVHALTKEKVAVKILDKKKMDKKTKRLLCREISSMEKLHHPNIIHLYEVIHTESKLHLVMEYASGGELFAKLSTQGMMNENDAKSIFAQILSAVQHMHQHNIIHRDLKAENVFYSENKHIKVGDFGFSTETKSAKQALNTFCGSPPYAAPELFRDSFYYGESVDVWALGVILYFVVTGTMPFRAETVGKLKKRILSGEFSIPSHVSSNCKELIRGILKSNPMDRHSTSDIRSSDWLADVVYPKSMGYYRLEPTRIDPTYCRPEESYALYQLKKLGLGPEELKNYHFPNGSSQSPFSWDAKSESGNSTQVTRKSLFGSSRSSQSNLHDRVEINENSAMVGIYRILLLRAHKRLSGPSGDQELRRLQAITTQMRRSSNESGATPRWRCSLCEVDSGHSSPRTSSPTIFLQVETQNGDSSTSASVCSSTGSRSTFDVKSTIDRSNNATHGDRRKVKKPRKRTSAAVKSRFCVIL